jgi:hypothetical protein
LPLTGSGCRDERPECCCQAEPGRRSGRPDFAKPAAYGPVERERRAGRGWPRPPMNRSGMPSRPTRSRCDDRGVLILVRCFGRRTGRRHGPQS